MPSSKSRVPRFGVGTLPAYIALSLTVIIISTLFYYTEVKSSNAEKNSDAAHNGEIEDGGEDPCEQPMTRGACSHISIDGLVFRYGYIEGSGDKSVIVDIGGPGTSILSGQTNLQNFVESLGLPSTYSVLFIEEPWVQQETTQSCKGSLTDFYLDSRLITESRNDSTTALIEKCELEDSDSLWGFTAESYTNLVKGIEEAESTVVEGFVGYSFGSTRLAYMGERQLDWAVLVRPFPVGASGIELINSRTEQVSNIFEGSAPVSEIPFEPEDASGSIPVNDFDYISAEIALGYLSSDEIDQYAPVLSGRADDNLARRLSDSFWLRYGENSISPAYLSYISEVCEVAQGWDTGGSSLSGHEAIITRIHEPCVEIGREYNEYRIEANDICIVVSENDPLASKDLVKSSLSYIPDDKWMESNEVSHRSSDGTLECLDRVL